jgi:hypothetical protein
VSIAVVHGDGQPVVPVLESERAVEENAFNPWNLEIASDELAGADAA